MSATDPIDVHRALQKAARELAFYADHGYEREYRNAIDNLEAKLQAVRSLPEASRKTFNHPGEVKTQDQQLHELRNAVLAMANALGDALPASRELISSLDALVDTAPSRATTSDPGWPASEYFRPDPSPYTLSGWQGD